MSKKITLVYFLDVRCDMKFPFLKTHTSFKSTFFFCLFNIFEVKHENKEAIKQKQLQDLGMWLGVYYFLNVEPYTRAVQKKDSHKCLYFLVLHGWILLGQP